MYLAFSKIIIALHKCHVKICPFNTENNYTRFKSLLIHVISCHSFKLIKSINFLFKNSKNMIFNTLIFKLQFYVMCDVIKPLS